ncbi:PTS sugar transporter subunit IIA [Salsuginibacillus kocurii]|uniref:PTS sugar transporter subunit IIA n=1 Tax=Salsuginibacillus kocurii TaxID=427078 RepID=UPI00037CB18A|nr:PTS sugar transporter subunit IIA [Salsuginibacillus kocurii]
MASTVLTKENIQLGLETMPKEEAIQKAGEILQSQGYVNEAYVKEMMAREELTSTYMGNYLAIPHGTEDAKKEIKETGISILLFDEPIDWDGEEVRLVIGIAGKGDEHLEILSNIAITCSDESKLEDILNANSADELLNHFTEVTG